MLTSAASLPPPAIALIGASGYGATHLRFLLELVGRGVCQLTSAVALADTSAETLGQLQAAGARIYPSFESWLAGERGRFDLVFLPTPTHLHARMAQAALAAGGSVLLEKPLAASWAEIGSLIQARPAPGRFLAIGFQDLYLPEVHAVKHDLLSGCHGRLRRIRVLGQWPRATAYYQRNQWAGRLVVPEGPVLDSPLGNALAHFLMLALFMAGASAGSAAQVLTGEGELYRARPIESFDTAAVRLATAEGVEIHVAMTHSGLIDRAPRLVFETDKNSIEWDAWEQCTIRTGDGRSVTQPLTKMDDIRRHLAAQLCARVHQPAGFVCSAALAAVHAALILDLHAGCPIHPVPPPFLRPSSLRGEPGVELIDVDEILSEASARGLLPSELNCPWARPSTRFEAAYSRRLAELSPSA